MPCSTAPAGRPGPRSVRAAFLLMVWLVSPASPAGLCQARERLLELRGRLFLPRAPNRPITAATVTLFGSTTPFAAQTSVLNGGRFKFSKLLPGSYTVVVYVPRRGEARQTVEVTESLADRHGRVYLELRLEARSLSPAEEQKRAIVSVRELAIPESARAEYERAFRLLKKPDVAGAVAHLEKAVSIAPHFSEALNTLGTIAYQRKDFSRAEGYFRRALESSPNSYEPLVNLGGALLSLDRPTDAQDFNRRAVEARPEDALANSQLGMNLFALGDLDQAVGYLKEAKRLDPAHFSHPQLVLAEIYLRRFDKAAAAGELEDFLKHHPDYPQAPKMRAEIVRLRAQPR